VWNEQQDDGLRFQSCIRSRLTPPFQRGSVLKVMYAHLHNAVEKAIANLPQKSVFKNGGEEFELRVLFPVSSWKTHRKGFRKEEFVIVGEDSSGNRFLLAPNGSVAFWDHETDEKTPLAPSMEAFLDSLSAPTPVVLKPGQVLSAWIDPDFLEEQRRKGNA
jgi:hypothetical protein